MNTKAQSSPRARRHFLVQFTLEADGRNPHDAIQDALDRIVRDGLRSAEARAEAIPAHPTDAAAVDRAVPERAAAHGSHDEFHGLFLG